MTASDTSHDADLVQHRIWRQMGGARRVELAVRMSEAARAIALDGIRARHREYSDEEAQSALLRLTLGDELFQAAYPGRPLLDA